MSGKEDRETPPEATKQVTLASMVKLKKDHPITLPMAFSKALYNEVQTPQMLMICSSSTKIIRLKPITNAVFHLILFLKRGIMTTFLEKLGQIYTDWQVKTLFSTCECEFQEKMCIYHGYLEAETLKGAVEEFTTQIKALPDVRGMEMRSL